MKRILVVFALAAAFAPAADLDEPRQLYRTTRYKEALQALGADSRAEALQLAGQCWFYLEDYKKSIEALEKALAQLPQSSELHLWLGRAWGRRAETANPLLAPRHATRARQYFEKAVALDPKNLAAMNDLFEYYLQAPGFLGGGREKAETMAQRIAALDVAEGHYARARLAEDRKDFSAAEREYRLAMTAAPAQVGRVLDLARFLARMGRFAESDALFEKAAQQAPDNPKTLFDRAASYVESKRNPSQARQLLEAYLKAPLTPDDPPRKEAEKLLRSL